MLQKNLEQKGGAHRRFALLLVRRVVALNSANLLTGHPAKRGLTRYFLKNPEFNPDLG
jgi:hypothetical protein